MDKLILSIGVLLMILVTGAVAEEKFETEKINTSAGDLKITFIGHGTLMFTFGGKRIHVDPFGEMAYYPKMPSADLEGQKNLQPTHLSEAIQYRSLDRNLVS